MGRYGPDRYDSPAQPGGDRGSGPRGAYGASGGYGAPSPMSGPRNSGRPQLAPTGRPAPYNDIADDPTYE